MIVKDHFLTGERFEIKKVSDGVLTTLPKINTKDLRRYYDSKNYHSHKSSKSLLSILYDVSSRFMVWRKVKLISRFSKNKKSILDFGCGRGGFLLSAKKAGFEVCGVESITTTYNELEVKNIKVYNKLESLSSPVNVITFWHSLEHINDVNQTLMLCRKFLKEKGILIVAVPNHDSFDAKHYKSFWAAYDVPRHRLHFNKKGVLKTVEKHGFKHLLTKPMWLDSVYVSILSEKYKGTKMFFLFGFFVGVFSNLLALFSKQYSSNIFIFEKTN
tara:strand:- start:162 stop:977 length:816 start_codon:yes stop_codon:yes gene_type:complete